MCEICLREAVNRARLENIELKRTAENLRSQLDTMRGGRDALYEANGSLKQQNARLVEMNENQRATIKWYQAELDRAVVAAQGATPPIVNKFREASPLAGR